MTITRLDSGRRMSEAVIHNGLVYLAGQVGNPGSTVGEQTLEALTEIEALLIRAGSSRDHMLSAQIWLADMADFDAMNAVWDQWIDGRSPPTRATGEAKLADPAYRVEIIITAAQA
jgi:enamine deaminase RidA (YjgF/YER057c/UK114 family)